MRLFAAALVPVALIAALAAWLARPAQTLKTPHSNAPSASRAAGSAGDARAHAAAEGAGGGGAESGAQDAGAAAVRAPLKLPLESPRLVVSKSARRMELYSGGRVVRAYRVGLGQRPEGDKERQGDLRTPEGEFYVCVKNPKSSFYLSLGLSYPNGEDAARGLRDKLITRAEHDRIVAAVGRKRRPPWDTALGGEIFIHGGGSATDWTWGCLALDNPDIKELFDSLPLGTPVSIKP
jgi:L,D-transpeptidase catalytic domain